MSGPPWLARRVDDRILCGRPAPGRGYCSGEVARIEWATGTDRALRGYASREAAVDAHGAWAAPFVRAVRGAP